MHYRFKTTTSVILVLIALIISQIPQLEAQEPRVYAFVSTDSPIYTPGSELIAEVFIYPQVNFGFTATIRFTTNIQGLSIPDITIEIPPISKTRFLKINSSPVRLPSNLGDGTYFLNMEIWVDNRIIARDTVEFWIRGGPPSGIMPMILFVWHNHQGPNYYYGLNFFAHWHISHFYSDGLGIYYKLSDDYDDIEWNDMGTYYLHYYLLKKYERVKVNLHYSPSLIYQLYVASKLGFTLRTPEGERINVSPDSPLAKVIMDFFNGLKELADQGRVYLMTSCFAHTILGYYIDRYDVSNLIKYDIELGMEWTEKLLVKTNAIWTPEMAWSDKLIPIYLDLGLSITVLDGTHHFPGASGDKDTIWEPYVIKGPLDRELIVFFRDQVVSDRDIGFTNTDWHDPRNADRDARTLYYNIYNIHSFKNYDRRPIHVIAADGENWMLFAPSVANGALFLDRIYQYIDKLTLLGIMETGTFADALKVSPPRRVLNSIPSTSWLGGWGKWTAEISDQIKAWELMDEAMGKYKSLEFYYETTDYSKYKTLLRTTPDFNETVIALIHAMDSDYWWTEFFSMSYIINWLSVFHSYANKLVKVDVSVAFSRGVLVKGIDNEVKITIKNINPYTLRSTKILINIEKLNQTILTVNLREGEYVTTSLTVKPGMNIDNVSITVMLTNPASKVYDRETYFTVYNKIFKAYNPVDFNVTLVIMTLEDVIVFDKYHKPGTFIFLIRISASEPPEYDVPIRYVIKIGRESYVGDTVVTSGNRYALIEHSVELKDYGKYEYSVFIEPLVDLIPDNNNITGFIEVTKYEQGIRIQALTPVAVIIVVIVIAAILLIKRRI
ncbi:MAG: glycoside hydrolase [Desulfurococcaceae archaeon]